MKFTEALGIFQRRPADAVKFPVALACGFTPLHLRTFLGAHLQSAMPDRRVEIETGLFGDIAGTIEALAQSQASSHPSAAAIAIEWADLDPRLGYRHTGGWGPSDLADIVGAAASALERLERGIRNVPDTPRVAVSLPTLPLPPVFYTPVWQSAEPELGLEEAVTSMGRRIARLPNAAIVNARRLGEKSPPASRLDLKSELLAGLPYTMAHADAVGQALANLIQPAAPKKGLITDLDDTLWSGILGDTGVEQIAWDLASHSQMHGLYQQLLRALAEQGALIGVASKNDPQMVDKAFERPDMLLPRDKVFPLDVNWGAKSASVARILRTWNIGADSVVFVDDSPMELAEVERAHPGIHCVRFPKDDYAAAASFLSELRGWFGKARVTEEDALRLESIRQGAELQRIVEGGSSAPEAFLAGMRARMTVDFASARKDPRVLELVNKTNQFNLNGVRFTEADWRGELAREGAFVASVAYEDRFGPLGKIAVIRGREDGATPRIGAWVMSCRAFARRVEHQCIRLLFERFAADAIHFDFVPTPKNGPLQEFFTSLIGEKPPGPFCLRRETFESKCPALYQNLACLDGTPGE